MRPFTSIRQKLFAGVLFTSLVALLVSCAGLFLYDLRSYRELSASNLEIEAQLLGYVTSGALSFEDRAVATQNLAFLKSRPTIRAAVIYGPRGERFAAYMRPGVPPAEIPATPAADQVSILGDRVAVFKPVSVNGEFLGTVYIAEDLAIAQRIGSYAIIALAIMVVSLAVSAFLSSWLQGSLTRPIIEISELARDVVDKRDYSLRASPTTGDEIATLVDAFNEMLSEIERRTSALENSSAEVSRLNKELEDRVRMRTVQLEESNLQLRAANLSKSSFLSMMSHEIRTPMNGVLGMLELLSLDQLGPQQRTTVEIVRESGRSLLRIIDDILDFSKIEAGKLEIRSEPASLAKVVASVVGIYAGNASSKALVLRSHVDPRISPAVMVDPTRLQQILNNLVSNAIKFTSKGSVEIRAELVEHRDGEDLVRVAVADTGMGISKEAQGALFEPFAQADGVTRVFGGTGLGLSIGRRLASLMNGSIAMESELGKGSVVTLTLALPIADPALLAGAAAAKAGVALDAVLDRRRPAPSIEEAEREGTLVLVVDDHPINRMLLMRQVAIVGYAVEAAEDGRDALAMWRTGRFRLVITDCNMPEMDGYELSRAIRAEEKRAGSAHTVIIACTANALKGEAENCFAAGMDDYVAKPVEIPTLMEKLDRWLPRPQGEAPAIDRSVLAEISGGDAAMEREILARFATAHEEDIAALWKALDERDVEGLRRAAHRIKGACAAVGAAALAQACADLEAAARAEDWDAVGAALDGFRREAARLSAALS